MKSISLLISLLFLSSILCESTDDIMQSFAKCARNQVGKPYVTYDVRWPDKFCNAGLVWYCRAQVGLSTDGTIYVYHRRIPKPKIGAHVYGIIKDYGPYVDSENLGVIVGVNPTYIVQGDLAKGTLVMKQFKENHKYVRTEYHYLDY